MTERFHSPLCRLGVLIAGAVWLSACQTAPTARSGLLSAYDGLADAQSGNLRAAVTTTRDDAAAERTERVFLMPAVLASGAGPDLTPTEHRLILREVDRQMCFELSERFTIVPEADADTATVKTFVVRIDPTGRAGSGVSAVANFFNPVPGVNVRAPGSTGGLAIESEMLSPDGTQVAAITWGRDAKVVGTDSPSLSAAGDALQLAEPMADAVANAFAPPSRKARRIDATADPCARFGPRVSVTGNRIIGAVTGVYVPQDLPEEEAAE